MPAVLEARAVITAVDETGKAFTSLKERIAGITRQTEAMNRVLGTVGAVSKNVEAFKLPPSAMSDMSKLVETTGRVDRVMANVNRSAVAMAGNVGKTSAEVVGLSAKLIDAGAKLKGIEDFKGTSRGVKEAALAAQKAQQDARILAAKIDGTPTPTRSLQAAHASALTEVRETEQALAKQVALAATARTALAELGVPVARLSSEEQRLKSVLDGTNAALLRQIELERQGAAAAEKAAAAQRLSADQDKRHHDALVSRFAKEDQARRSVAGHGGGHDGHGFVNYALTSAAMAVSAHEVVNLGREAWDKGAELNHERIGLQNAGRTPHDIQEIEAAARKVVSTLPTANFTESMKVMAETTQAFGSVEHAIDNLPFMMRTMSILKAAGGEHIHGSAGDVGRALAKTFEERQTRPEDFEKEASAMIPAMVASGGTFNPEQLYAFAQQAKSSLPSLSMRFLSKIAPSLIGAQGGDRAGTALNAFESVISGKANDKKQAEEWLKLGLLDPSQVVMKAGHATSWKSGAVKDTFLAMTDPLAWSEKYLIPALQKQGVDTTNREAVKQILDTMFRNQNANVFASEITQAASRARLHKDEALINEVGDEDGIYHRNLADFGVAAGALKNAIGNLAAATTAPLMRSSAGALAGLAAILNNVARYGFEHPTQAAAAGIGVGAAALGSVGYIGKKLFDGFGLKGSALALDAAAAHLMEVGGGPGGWSKGGAATAGAAGAEGIGTAIAIPEIATATAAVLALVGAAAVTELVKKSAEAQEPGKGGQWAPPTMETEPLDRQRLADNDADIQDLKNKIATEQGRSKLPAGEESPNLLRLRLDLEEKQNQRKLLAERLDGLHAYKDREGERGRAFMTLPRPDGQIAPYVDREADRGRAYAGLRTPEEFGPPVPPSPAGIERRTFGAYLRFARPEAAMGDMPLATRPDGGPVPVAIVSAPPAAHDGWLDGDRPGIEERSRRGAAMFRADHEGTVGQRMMDHDAEVAPHVDTSGLDAAKAKGGEVHDVLAALAAIVISPSVNLSVFDSIIVKAREAKAAVDAIGAGRASGTSGAVGTSYPQTAPTGRQGGPR